MPQLPGGPPLEFPGVFAPNNVWGTNWTNPTNVIFNDDQRATYNRNLGTDWLWTTGYEFPLMTRINRVTVTLQGMLLTNVTGVAYLDMQLTFDDGNGNPVPVGEIKRYIIPFRTPANEGALETYSENAHIGLLGAVGDTWGIPLADWNNLSNFTRTGFGVRIRCSPSDASSTFSALRALDTVRIQLHDLGIPLATEGVPVRESGSWPPLPKEDPVTEDDEFVQMTIQGLQSTVNRSWTDEALRKQFAGEIHAMVTHADMSMQPTLEKFLEMERVVQGKQVLHSIDFGKRIVSPYMLPIVQQRINSFVSSIAQSFQSARPFFKLLGGQSETDRHAVESDINELLLKAELPRYARLIAREAAIFGRGPFQLTCEPATAWQPVKLKIIPIKMRDFYVYPHYIRDIPDAILVGHRMVLPASDITARIHSGAWLPYQSPDDYQDLYAEPAGGLAMSFGGPEMTSTQRSEDRPVHILDCIVRVATSKNFPIGEWRVVMDLAAQHILRIERYSLPAPWYFAPVLDEETDHFLPTTSLALNMRELQVIANDAATVSTLGMASQAFPNILVSNFNAGDAQSITSSFGSITAMRGNPQVHILPSTFNSAQAMAFLAMIGNFADGISRQSMISQGQQLRGEATATEAHGLIAGASAGADDYRHEFVAEWIRAVKFALFLTGVHWQQLESCLQHPKTTDPSLFVYPFDVAFMGVSARPNPRTVIESIGAIAQTASTFGLQEQLNAPALVRTLVNAMEFMPSDENILIEQSDDPYTAGIEQELLEEEYARSLADALGMGQEPSARPGTTATAARPDQQRGTR